MIGYFDTSALVPLAVAEPSSTRCMGLWDVCDQRFASMLAIAEGHAALAQALRLDRLTPDDHQAACAVFDARIGAVDLVVASRSIIDTAARLALDYALRGYDAVHAATALALADDELVVISGDAALLTACQAMGLATADINRPVDVDEPADS